MTEPLPDLEPPISRRKLDTEVKALRDLAADEFAKREGELRLAIAAHIEAYDDAVERLTAAHAAIASGTDIEIGAETRWSAIWELSGRCLSECRLLIHALRGGFALEASSNERAVFEALYLLGAITDDDDVLRAWLRGEYVRPKTAREAMARMQQRATERMAQAGVEPAGDLVSSGEWLYDYYSQSAHHRRGPITASISLKRREFAYGPHPDPVRRAREMSNAGQTIETALIVVIASLAHIVGPDGLDAVLSEQAGRLTRVRDRYPLIEPDGDTD